MARDDYGTKLDEMRRDLDDMVFDLRRLDRPITPALDKPGEGYAISHLVAAYAALGSAIDEFAKLGYPSQLKPRVPLGG